MWGALNGSLRRRPLANRAFTGTRCGRRVSSRRKERPAVPGALDRSGNGGRDPEALGMHHAQIAGGPDDDPQVGAAVGAAEPKHFIAAGEQQYPGVTGRTAIGSLGGGLVVVDHPLDKGKLLDTVGTEADIPL